MFSLIGLTIVRSRLFCNAPNLLLCFISYLEQSRVLFLIMGAYFLLLLLFPEFKRSFRTIRPMLLLCFGLLVKHMQFSQFLAIVAVVPDIEVRIIDRYSAFDDVLTFITLSMNLLSVGLHKLVAVSTLFVSIKYRICKCDYRYFTTNTGW